MSDPFSQNILVLIPDSSPNSLPTYLKRMRDSPGKLSDLGLITPKGRVIYLVSQVMSRGYMVTFALMHPRA